MTKLGDSVSKFKPSSFSAVGVSKILKSPAEMGKVKGFAMRTLPFQVMATRPGTKSDKEHENAVRHLKAEVVARNREVSGLRQRLESETYTSYHKGLAEGEIKGHEAAKTQEAATYNKSLEEIKSHVQDAVNTLGAQRASLFLDFEKNAVDIILKSIKKVFDTIPQEYPQMIGTVIKKAMDALGRFREITVRVNPEDFQSATDTQTVWLPVQADTEGVSIKGDERVARGSCLIESESTTVEMNLQNIMGALEKDFNQILDVRRSALTQGGGPETQPS